MTDHQAWRKQLNGIAVSEGIIIGKAHVVDRSKVKIFYQYLIDDNELNREVERFRKALKTTEEQLVKLRDSMPELAKQHAFILESHLMILKDENLTESTTRRILEQKINAEWALKESLNEIRKIFDQIDDQYISGRITDVENVVERILRNLTGDPSNALSEINERVIIVAHDLSPADTSELNTNKVMGFITDVGGKTSHTAIMAQALAIPAVVGLEKATGEIRDEDLLIVDGSSGEVIVNPDDDDIIRYQERQLRYEKYKSSIARFSHLPAETTDGQKVSVQANIELLEEAKAVVDYGGEGIGLYRTEFLYLRSKGLPTEEELFEDYREVTELISPYPVTIRTLDLGGDKFASELDISKELNPALGLRAIRFCLKKPDIFKTQLRAILRSSVYGRVKLMLPMISGVQEVLEAKSILEEVKEDLSREGKEFDPHIPIGIMIEIPSAVSMADLLAEHVDFFSVGTNDLIQYSLAIDRVNEHVAYMYQPFHPAILRMIQHVLSAATNAGIEVSVCGEMAGEPLCISCLLGMGITQLSMNPRAIPLIKNIIRSFSIKEARADFERVIQLSTAAEVREYVVESSKSLLPELEKWRYG